MGQPKTKQSIRWDVLPNRATVYHRLINIKLSTRTKYWAASEEGQVTHADTVVAVNMEMQLIDPDYTSQ